MFHEVLFKSCLHYTPLHSVHYLLTSLSLYYSLPLNPDDTQLLLLFDSSTSNCALQQLVSLLRSVQSWMASNKLILNPSITKDTSQQLQTCQLSWVVYILTIQISAFIVSFSNYLHRPYPNQLNFTCAIFVE